MANCLLTPHIHFRRRFVSCWVRYFWITVKMLLIWIVHYHSWNVTFWISFSWKYACLQWQKVLYKTSGFPGFSLFPVQHIFMLCIASGWTFVHLCTVAQYLPNMPEVVGNASCWCGRDEWTPGDGCYWLEFNRFKWQRRYQWQQQWRGRRQCSDCQLATGWRRKWLHCWRINRICCRYSRPHSVERRSR